MTQIAVIDNHGQFTHLEQRALRDLRVDVSLLDNETDPDTIDADGVVLSGGPDITRIGRCPEYISLEVPVFGICLGMQVLAVELGGEVGPGEYGGYADIDISILDNDDPLVGPLAPHTRVWASHADEVKTVPPGFTQTATSEVCGIEAMSNTDRDLYGVQWHPEVAHTEEGKQVFQNFLSICA